MREVFELAERTKKETNGYFDIARTDGTRDPSGIVKGWAIRNACKMLEKCRVVENFYIDAGGDIAVCGKNTDGAEWSVGIKNPFKQEEIVKVIYPRGKGVATSGTYVPVAQHIYNPHNPQETITDIVSLTVVGQDVLEADRIATSRVCDGTKGNSFIEKTPGLEGYLIDKSGTATMTTGFEPLTRL